MSLKALPLASGLILIILTSLLLVAPYATASTSDSTTWSKTYGGPGSDRASAMIRTREGGYAMLGTTNSYGSGLINAWLVKTDVDGNELWNQTYSGLGQGIADALVQTDDGGYAATGYTYSLDQSTGQGSLSMWVLRTDYLGNLLWNRTYSQVGTAIGYYIIQTTDEGFAVVGTSNSIGIGAKAAWLLKIDGNGILQWYKVFSYSSQDEMYSVIQTSDGGYILGGDTTLSSSGQTGLWLVKTDSNGDSKWNQTYNLPGSGVLSTMVQTTDGSYALTGALQVETGGAQFLMVKTDSSGNMQWYKTYNVSRTDNAYSGIQTSDGGYALLGAASSDTSFYKALLVKTAMDGSVQWTQTYGGNAEYVLGAIVQIPDGSYMLAGYTNSTGAGAEDFWLVKTDSNGYVPLPSSSGATTTSSPSSSSSGTTNPPTPAPSSSNTPNGFAWTSTMTLAVVAAVVIVAIVGGGYAVYRNSLKNRGRKLVEKAKSKETEGNLLEAALCYARACKADIQTKAHQPAIEALGKYVTLAKPLVLNAALSNKDSKQLRKIGKAHLALTKSISSRTGLELLERPATQKARDLGTLLDDSLSSNLDFVVDEALKDRGVKKQLQAAVSGVGTIPIADAAEKLGYTTEATLKLLEHALDQRLISGGMSDDYQTFTADLYFKKQSTK